MKSQAYRIRQTETGVIEHNGNQFAATGSSVHGKQVTGYLGKHGELLRWDGLQMLSGARHHDIGTLRWGESGDDGNVCAWKLTHNRWIVGWAMNGEGSLFRGELTTIDEGSETDKDDEAHRQAFEIAYRWIDIDVEDQLRDQQEQAKEMQHAERWDGLS